MPVTINLYDDDHGDVKVTYFKVDLDSLKIESIRSQEVNEDYYEDCDPSDMPDEWDQFYTTYFNRRDEMLAWLQLGTASHMQLCYDAMLKDADGNRGEIDGQEQAFYHNFFLDNATEAVPGNIDNHKLSVDELEKAYDRTLPDSARDFLASGRWRDFEHAIAKGLQAKDGERTVACFDYPVSITFLSKDLLLRFEEEGRKPSLTLDKNAEAVPVAEIINGGRDVLTIAVSDDGKIICEGDYVADNLDELMQQYTPILAGRAEAKPF